MLRELKIVRGQSLPAKQSERRKANQFCVSSRSALSEARRESRAVSQALYPGPIETLIGQIS